jgi:hypothetical protein
MCHRSVDAMPGWSWKRFGLMLLQSMERSRVHLLWKHDPASEKHEWYSATLLTKCGYLLLDRNQDGPATVFAGCADRLRQFWHLCRHEVLRILSSRGSRGYGVGGFAASSVLQQPRSRYSPLFFHLWVTAPFHDLMTLTVRPRSTLGWIF